MSHVVGIDLSTRAIDLVKLSETDNTATWTRKDLAGPDAWTRTLQVRDAISGRSISLRADWWDDVYLVAIETPVNDQKRVLSRVQGAVLASLPAKLRQPHCCWDVHPSTWKAWLGLKSKPTWFDITDRCQGADIQPRFSRDPDKLDWQNGRDAYCLALYARNENARAVEKALTR